MWHQQFCNTTRLVKSLSRSGHASIIEAYCEHIDKETRLRLRVLGFWNPVGKCYHWYVTNLKVAGSLIYPLYRLRWQIELMFKGCKQSFKLDDINSGNKNIIESLLLGSLVAQICAQTILRNSLSRLNEDRQFAVSYQRINKVFVHLAPQIISFIVNKHEDSPVRLAATIDIFVWELFDPNYHHRRSSIAQIQDAL